MAGPLSITNCEAAAVTNLAGSTIVVTFSEPVDGTAVDPLNYTVTPYLQAPSPLDGTLATIQLALNDTTAIIELTATFQLARSQWIQIDVKNVTPRGGGTAIAPPNNVFFTQVHADDVGVAAGDIALNTGRIATNTGSIATNTGGIATSAGSTSQAVEDLAAFSLLTEEIGYSPSPLARPSGGGGAMAPAAGGALGQIATKAVSDVLGWKVKPDRMGDPKGFLGALNASFKLQEIEGHTEAIWTPRTYAIQTDLSGGITGAQASVYKRAKDALDQSLPLLDGLYPLRKEAKDEDVAALRATVRSQFTDLVNELGLLGGPRISRVTQFFFLLLGQPNFPQNTSQLPFPLVTDPDKIAGSLGNLRVEFGFRQADDRVNTVEDEQDVTNFRIVTDYVTSLAQSWLNNLQFFGLGTPTPFFGTQLVLLSRQLSVIAESVNEVRFTLDSVFIGPAERQTLQIDFGPPAPIGTPPMFLEDLLTWIDSFASEEGPRLIQDGGKFAVGKSFVPIGTQLQTLVAGAVPDTVTPANVLSLPRGYRTKRVRRSLEELRDQLQELVNLAAPISHVITPEPEPELAVLGIHPNVAFITPQNLPTAQIPITIVGTGFAVGTNNATVSIVLTATNTSVVQLTPIVLTSNLIHATLIGSALQPGPNEITITVTNPTQGPAPLPTAVLETGFTVVSP